MAMPASNLPNVLEIRSLHVRFGSQTVLRNVDFTVPKGQTLAIIGESGCGKTVMLKTLLGLVKPAQGEVLFDGKNLAKLNDRDLVQQRIRFGYLFQNAALFDSMTIGQNVAFPLRQHRNLPELELKRVVLDRLAEVGLPDSVVVKKPAELSGGMRKRVGMARALILSPEMMLYDEPTTGLDPIMSDVINELMISTRQKHGVTSVLVTHDMKSAKKVADRIVMLYPLSRLRENEPQILFDGTPEQIERCGDSRVTQFVRGEAGERLMEMAEQAEAESGA